MAGTTRERIGAGRGCSQQPHKAKDWTRRVTVATSHSLGRDLGAGNDGAVADRRKPFLFPAQQIISEQRHRTVKKIANLQFLAG
jgi:hypothetical protein